MQPKTAPTKLLLRAFLVLVATATVETTNVTTRTETTKRKLTRTASNLAYTSKRVHAVGEGAFFFWKALLQISQTLLHS